MALAEVLSQEAAAGLERDLNVVPAEEPEVVTFDIPGFPGYSMMDAVVEEVLTLYYLQNPGSFNGVGRDGLSHEHACLVADFRHIREAQQKLQTEISTLG